MNWPLFAIALEVENDVVIARQRARQTAASLGFDKQDQVRIATAVSEIARNGLTYGGGGRISFALQTNDGNQTLQITIQDNGPGIADIDLVLSGAYKSKTGMGVGLNGTRRLLDDLQIVSQPGAGTRVTLFKRLPSASIPINPERLPDLVDSIRRDAPSDPFSELREQNRELIETSERLRRKQQELESTNASLQESNRGVLALYAELEDKAAELKSASEARARLHANVSHELRTPIQSIVAIAQLLAMRVDGELTEEQQRQVDYIQQSAGSLSGLVDDLLDLAKTDAGRLKLEITEFSVEKLFGTLRGALLPLVRSSAVKLLFVMDPAIDVMTSDEAKLGQIVRNLVSNALKFTVEGQVAVEARMIGERIAFTVRDTGIGMEQSDHQRIFEPFEQIPNSLQAGVRGTGLGLSFSAKLAELLGGGLSVESAVGKGSTFTLLVPRTYEAFVPIAQTFRQALIVDDDVFWRVQLRKAVEPFCNSIVESPNGADALMSAGLSPPDLLITDLSMPTIGGLELIDAVRREEWGLDLPIVVVSALQLSADQRGGLGQHTSVLAKNAFDSGDLRSILHRIAAGKAP